MSSIYGLYSSLDQTVSALNAESVAINVTGTNLSNVNNPNYSREVVDLGSLGTVQTPEGSESMGLTALGVSQIRSSILDAQVRNSNSSTSYYNTLQSAYQQAQAALGQTVSSTASASPSSTSGLDSAISGFFNAFQSYAANPTSTGQQQAVLEAANILTSQLQSTDQNLAQVQTGLASQVTTNVASANSLLTDVASLNSQIAQFESGSPGSAVSLRDQREGDLEQLAQYMPITVTEGATGEDQVTATDGSGNPVVLVNNASVTGPLTVSGSQISGGSTPTVLGLGSGSIQGSIDASNNGVQSLRDSLDQLSSQLVTSVNAAYNPSNTAGGNFFLSSGTTAATITTDPSLTVSNLHAGSTTNASDNTVALAVANLANQQFSTGSGDQITGTFNGFYDNSVSGFGQTLAGVNDQATNETNIQTLVSTQRSSLSGVSLDEEMANLLMYQRSYQASSQVFQTIDSLIDVTVNSLGTLTT
jgi:flagellar hook-associated protein 1 FlgK